MNGKMMMGINFHSHEREAKCQASERARRGGGSHGHGYKPQSKSVVQSVLLCSKTLRNLCGESNAMGA